jgi:hypothetical protein
MAIGLPLDKMTAAEKLQVLEEIWDDLCRTPADVPSPPWHGDVLQDREKRVHEGSSEFVDWDKAKRDIRETPK